MRRSMAQLWPPCTPHAQEVCVSWRPLSRRPRRPLFGPQSYHSWLSLVLPAPRISSSLFFYKILSPALDSSPGALPHCTYAPSRSPSSRRHLLQYGLRTTGFLCREKTGYERVTLNSTCTVGCDSELRSRQRTPWRRIKSVFFAAL